MEDMLAHSAAASVVPIVVNPLVGVPLTGIGYWFESTEINPLPATVPNPLPAGATWTDRVQETVSATFDPEFYYTNFRVSGSLEFHGSTPYVDFTNNSQMDLGGGNFTILVYGYTVGAGGFITANFMRNKASTSSSDPGFLWHAPNSRAYISDGTNQIEITTTGGMSGIYSLNYLSYENGTLTSGYINTSNVLFEKTATGTPIGSWSNTQNFYWGDTAVNAQPGYYSTLLGYTIGIDQLVNSYTTTTGGSYTRAEFLGYIRDYLSVFNNRQINPFA